MKKIFLTLVVVMMMATAAIAQPRAIGARLGGDVEFSYQHSFASRNMIDLSVGAYNYWGHDGYGSINATCMFDWVFNITGGLNWYVGPGFGVGYIWDNHYDGNHIRLNLGAQIGLEYQFNIPLNLSLDWRPMTNVLSGYHDYFFDYYSLALGIRYRF